eukprot:SAG22_NODE_2078_length_3044_cov_1.691681_1_plen_145_part_00
MLKNSDALAQGLDFLVLGRERSRAPRDLCEQRRLGSRMRGALGRHCSLEMHRRVCKGGVTRPGTLLQLQVTAATAASQAGLQSRNCPLRLCRWQCRRLERNEKPVDLRLLLRPGHKLQQPVATVTAIGSCGSSVCLAPGVEWLD